MLWNLSFLIMHLCGCLCVWVCVYVSSGDHGHWEGLRFSGTGIAGSCELCKMGAENWTSTLNHGATSPAPWKLFQKQVCQDSTPNHSFFVMYVGVWKYVVWRMFCKGLKLLSSFLGAGPLLGMLGNSSTTKLLAFYLRQSLTTLPRLALNFWSFYHSLLSSRDYRPVLQAWLKPLVSTLLKEPLLLTESLEWQEARVTYYCSLSLLGHLISRRELPQCSLGNWKWTHQCSLKKQKRIM